MHWLSLPMIPAALVALVTTAATARAQRPAPVELPHLTRLGPIPTDAAVMILTADGRLAKPSGQPAAPASVLLRIDRATPFTGVAKLLAQLQDGGTERVLFAAALPDGTEGAFTFALPEAATAPVTAEIRLHRHRAAVPATSVVPLLERMQKGIPDPNFDFTVAIEAPTEAEFEYVLQSLAAVRQAGIEAVMLREGERGGHRPAEVDGGLGALANAFGEDAATTAEERTSGGFAIDLGPLPWIAVSGRVLPQDRPAVLEQPVGCGEPVPNAQVVDEFGGGAGGRFGGRGRKVPPKIGTPIAAGLDWLTAQQNGDGSFNDDAGDPDVGATALALLALLGDGRTLHTDANLARGIGWLVDRQDENGDLGGSGAGSAQRHALATYALAEAYGLSNALLLRGSLVDAIDSLDRYRADDGGFGDATADASSTALAILALESAKFFAVEGELTAARIVGWFDALDASPTATPTTHAAALFCRHFAGMDPRTTPAMSQGAGLVADKGDVADPWCAYWATYGLFQTGGAPWKSWSPKLSALAAEQVGDGADAGSWRPTAGCSRTATTALRLLTLECYSRYTRIVR